MVQFAILVVHLIVNSNLSLFRISPSIPLILLSEDTILLKHCNLNRLESFISCFDLSCFYCPQGLVGFNYINFFFKTDHLLSNGYLIKKKNNKILGGLKEKINLSFVHLYFLKKT